jgi:hypothetical protein
MLCFTSHNGKETVMEIRWQKNGPVIGSPMQTLNSFCSDIHARQASWEERVVQDPAVFHDVQLDIQRHFNQGADRLAAAILARVTQRPEMKAHVQRVRQHAVVPLQTPERRPLKLRLLSGLVVWLTVLYCPPRSKGAKRTDDQEQLAGLYPELAALGIRHGDSPALQALVARTMALCPSIAAARKELRRQGVKLDTKTVRRIAEQLGTEFLAWRRRELFAWRRGLVPAGDELAGCRVAVQIDGGRVRVRENKKRSAKRKKGQRRKFHTPWREPKALIIYVFDAQGKRDKQRLPLIDGTLLGPDHVAELVAWHLHRLGAAKAETVVFVSDGAPWIWDRLDWIIARAGLEASRTVRVLDWCHAVEHISRALTLLKLTAPARCKTFVEMRTLLKQSRHAEIVAELERLAGKRSKKHKVWTEIRYLRKHGEAGHLQYLTFKRRGLPFGSGAIESTIRRVINLRLKSNAIYWLAENAEAVFALRGALLSDRWESMLREVERSMSRDARLTWQWSAPTISPDAVLPSPPTSPELPTPKAVGDIAA